MLLSTHPCRQSYRVLADSRSSSRWSYWATNCDVVYVTQCVAFLGALTALVAIDSDFISGNDQVPVGYVILATLS